MPATENVVAGEVELMPMLPALVISKNAVPVEVATSKILLEVLSVETWSVDVPSAFSTTSAVGESVVSCR